MKCLQAFTILYNVRDPHAVGQRLGRCIDEEWYEEVGCELESYLESGKGWGVFPWFKP